MVGFTSLYTPSIVAPPTTDSTPTQPQQPSSSQQGILFLHDNHYNTAIIGTVLDKKLAQTLIRTLVHVLHNSTATLNKYFQNDPNALSLFAAKMCEAGVITAGLRNNPVYNNIETLFASMMDIYEEKEEFEKHCTAFLTALASQGGPFALISNKISQKWRNTVSSELNISLSL